MRGLYRSETDPSWFLVDYRPTVRQRLIALAGENFEHVISQEYISGATQKFLAEKYCVSPQVISKILYRTNTQMRDVSKRLTKYPKNDVAFDSVTEQSAYWAGFICADGSIGGGRHGVGQHIIVWITVKDASHIRKLLDFLSPQQEVKFKSFQAFGKMNDSAGTDICSQRLVAALAHLGVTAQKSYFVNLNAELAVSKHFWRGAIDGDGSITPFDSLNRSQLTLCGSESFCECFVAFVKGLFSDCQVSVKVHNQCKKLWTVSLCGRYAHRLIDFLYSDATVYLNRKHSLVQSLTSHLCLRQLHLNRGYGAQLSEQLCHSCSRFCAAGKMRCAFCLEKERLRIRFLRRAEKRRQCLNIT